MELEAADAIRVVTHRHHHSVEVGVDGESCRDIAAHQRVIAGHRQRVAQTGKHRLSVMFNTGSLTVEDFAGLADVAAVGFDNRLVAEADTDNRQLAAHAG